MELGGRIQDLHTGELLVGVQVECSGQGRQIRVFSGPNGGYVLQDLTPGDWLLKFSKCPYKAAQVAFVLTGNSYTGTLGLEIPSLQDEHVTA